MLRIKLVDLAVVLIDMQDDFIGENEEKKGLIPNQISLLNFCRTQSIPLILVEYSNHGKTNKMLMSEIDKLPPAIVHKIMKSTDDAFERTNFKDLLMKLQKNTLLLTGVNACACVYDTAVTAVKYGFSIVTSKTLIAGFCGMCSNNGRKEEDIKWYEENACFSQDHNHIIQNLM